MSNLNFIIDLSECKQQRSFTPRTTWMHSPIYLTTIKKYSFLNSALRRQFLLFVGKNVTADQDSSHHEFYQLWLRLYFTLVGLKKCTKLTVMTFYETCSCEASPQTSILLNHYMNHYFELMRPIVQSTLIHEGYIYGKAFAHKLQHTRLTSVVVFYLHLTSFTEYSLVHLSAFSPIGCSQPFKVDLLAEAIVNH